jgi:hypothetical protein
MGLMTSSWFTLSMKTLPELCRPGAPPPSSSDQDTSEFVDIGNFVHNATIESIGLKSFDRRLSRSQAPQFSLSRKRQFPGGPSGISICVTRCIDDALFVIRLKVGKKIKNIAERDWVITSHRFSATPFSATPFSASPLCIIQTNINQDTSGG